jgi:glutamine synthetase
MPGSLEEALSRLEDDHAFLMKGDVFTEELLETYIDYKSVRRQLFLRIDDNYFSRSTTITF